jgi:tetratricopeptide (TPR) repeat protein
VHQGRQGLIRRFLAGTLLTICATAATAIGGQAAPQVPEGQLDASRALFTVLAAINAAGYDDGLNAAPSSPLRAEVRRAIEAAAPPCLDSLKKFYTLHRRDDPTQEVSQYISFGLSIEGPPDFAWRYKLNELPPDAMRLEGLQALLARFYKEAGIAALWDKAQPAFDQVIARYHAPVLAAINEVNAYLRTSNTAPLGTRFQIYVDQLAAPGQVQTRSFRNDYYVVVTPSAEPQVENIRHAYLHFMLDPLAVRYANELDSKGGLLDYALGAPSLDSYYKEDFQRLASECLVKAVEARLAPPAARQARVDEALREGFVVTPAFADALAAYEKQEQSLRFYYRDLVAAIDLSREERRLANLQFATQPPAAKGRAVHVEHAEEPTGAYKTLQEAERFYYQKPRDIAKAKAAYQRALEESQEKPVQAKAYYGLARIAALENDPETAQKLFEKTLELGPDPESKAWACVYLGRLAEAAGEPAQALERYRAALAVDGAPEPARRAAEQGIQKTGGQQ